MPKGKCEDDKGRTAYTEQTERASRAQNAGLPISTMRVCALKVTGRSHLPQPATSPVATRARAPLPNSPSYTACSSSLGTTSSSAPDMTWWWTFGAVPELQPKEFYAVVQRVAALSPDERQGTTCRSGRIGERNASRDGAEHR